MLVTATINSVVEDVQYLDSFTLHDPKHKSKFPARVPAAATANTDKDGKVWQSPFEWLNQAYGEKRIKTWWMQDLAGNGVCPICHKLATPHLPQACPLLKDLNLKLVRSPAPSSIAPPAPTPTGATPAASPTPVGNPAAALSTSGSGSLGLAPAPSSLTALMAVDYDSDDSFRWAGDEDGVDYVAGNSKPSTSSYTPSCNHARLHISFHSSPATASPPSSVLPGASSTRTIDLPTKVRDLISHLPSSTIFGTTKRCFVVADTGATDHMFPNKSAFISYNLVSNLQVCMGNNAYIPVLGHGTPIITLNGKRILVRNTLHVPGLVVPLYSLRAHLTQRGCGFIKTNELGMLVYFPQVVLSVDMSSDCHLSYKPIGSGTPLDSLHYIPPHCLPTLYPSDQAASSNTATQSTPSPVLVEDNTSMVAPSAPSTPPSDSPTDMLTLATHLCELSDRVLQSAPPSTSKPPPSPPLALQPRSTTDVQSNQPALLLTM